MPTYQAFASYPATGPVTSPRRELPLVAAGGKVRLTLTGPDFSVRVQISNAKNTTGPEHLFIPPDNSFETTATLTPSDMPYTLDGPARWFRLVLDSGTVNGGQIEEDETRTPDNLVSRQVLLDQLIAGTVSDLAMSPGKVNGDARQVKGRTYFWDANSTEAVDPNGVTVLAAAGVSTGRWVLTDREWGLNLNWFKGLVTGLGTASEDWIPAINAALAIDSVYIPSGTYLVQPTATNYIKFPVNAPRTLSGSGAASLLKVADGTGNYGQLIGQTSSASPVMNIRLTRFRIDQNPDANVGTVTVADANAFQDAIYLKNFAGVDVDGVTFDLSTGVNVIALNAANSSNATIRNCRINWGRNLSTAGYDNSTIYVECYDHKVLDNVITARGNADIPRGAIETHGAQTIVRGNTVTGFRHGINIIPFYGVDARAALTNSQLIEGNTLSGGANGIRVWLLTGRTTRNVSILNNIVALDQAVWPTLTAFIGIGTVDAADGTLSGDLDGLRIEGNDVRFSASETRSNLDYANCMALSLSTRNNTMSNIEINHNTWRNAPVWAWKIGHAVGGVVKHVRATGNSIINAGNAVNQTPTAARVPFAFYGLVQDVLITDSRIIEDSAAPLASALLFTSLTSGSDIRFERTNVASPYNLLEFPDALPTGVTVDAMRPTVWSSTLPPASGTFKTGAIARLLNPSSLTSITTMTAITAGTLGTLSGVTGSLPGNSTVLTITGGDISALRAGDYLTVGGSGLMRIKTIDVANSLITMTANVVAAYSGAVSYAVPAFATVGGAPSLSADNAYTGKQTIVVSGKRAVDALSDTFPAGFFQATTASGAIGQSTSNAGLSGLSGTGTGGTFQQIGTLSANLTSATLLVQRQSSMGDTFNITAATLRVDDSGVVTTGTRTNNLAEFRWDGTLKFTVSGGSNAMGAGIITTGGWGRASTTFDFPSIAAGAEATTTVTLTGARLTDTPGNVGCNVASIPASGIRLRAWISANDTVTIGAYNGTGAAIDPASATYYVQVFK